MQIVELEVGKIIPYEKNPRHNEGKSIDKVATSIRKFGFKVPMVVDKDHVIITGHTRFQAALKLGMDKVPVIIAKDLSQKQIKAYRIADNRVNEDSEWNWDLLRNELAELSQMDFDLEELGFEQYELKNILTDLEESEFDPEKEWTDMPEFQSEGYKPHKSLLVHFWSEEALQEFLDFTGQPVTDKTKVMNLPKQEVRESEEYRYGFDIIEEGEEE